MTDRGDWWYTVSGRKVYVRDPRPEDICIEDIACALSNVCRFCGHVRPLYSVAQHSVLASRIRPELYPFHKLMHDAAEAYCGDVIRPLKHELGRAYKDIEHAWERAVAERFDIIWTPDALREVAYADSVALVTERRDLGRPEWRSQDWIEDDLGVQPLEQCIERALTPAEAEKAFLARFAELTSLHDLSDIGGAR